MHIHVVGDKAREPIMRIKVKHEYGGNDGTCIYPVGIVCLAGEEEVDRLMPTYVADRILSHSLVAEPPT